MLRNSQVAQRPIDHAADTVDVSLEQDTATLLLCPPDHFDVTYQINPWMDLDGWHARRDDWRAKAMEEWQTLKAFYESLGHRVMTIEPAHGQPDMVFMANCAAVLDGTAVMAHFRHPERQGEEPFYRHFYAQLKNAGVIDAMAFLPEGIAFEGCGDALWDGARGMFWIGYSQRTSRRAPEHVSRALGVPAVALEMATERFYHLDVALMPLSGGEVVYLPQAFNAAGLRAIHRHVPPQHRIEASNADAGMFAVNLVNIGKDIVMSGATPALRKQLEDAGYTVHIVETPAFQLAGGSIFCLTQRLDRRSKRAGG
ncbi:MAG: arginine deiminase-related protein [Pseudomonadota bacterium]